MRSQRRSSLALGIALAVVSTIGCHDDDVLTPSGCGAAGSGAPAVVRAVPSGPSTHPTTYRVGDIVTLAVRIEGGTNVGAVPFHLLFDESILEFSPPAEEGAFMSCDGAATVFLASSASPGEIVAALSRLEGGDGASGSGDLATFRFGAIAAGPVAFAFTGASVKDPQARTLPASFIGASISVDP